MELNRTNFSICGMGHLFSLEAILVRSVFVSYDVMSHNSVIAIKTSLFSIC